MKTKRRGKMKRGDIQEEEEVEEEEEQRRPVCKYGGDGVAWFRGSMLGKGAFGSVYLANSKKPNSRYGCFPSIMAVKSAEASVSGSIQKEKEVLSNIGNCPNIIKSYGEEVTTAENRDMVYNLLLEYGSGGTLADLIKKSGGCGLPLYDVRYYAKSILLGLNHIHQSGYVRCDLKPENILLVTNNTGGSGAKFKAKIGDFGLTKKVKHNNKKRKLESYPYLRGTPMYLSPEVIVDGMQEAPSDIWAFGCIVLEMLTGKSPWVGKEDLDAEALLSLIGKGGESPKLPDDLSREAREFLKGCFSRNTMFRLTTEMLLFHSFIEGVVVDDDDDNDVDEVEEGEELINADVADDLPLMLHESHEECSNALFSDEYGFDGEEFPSFDEDGIWEDQQSAVSIAGSIAPSLYCPLAPSLLLPPMTHASNQGPRNTMQQPPITFTIPAGV